MPPKKKEDAQEEVGAARFGRVRNNLKMGIVGLPNVGKSSLFNLLVPVDRRGELSLLHYRTERGAMRGAGRPLRPVSYTHLTLPTICSV